MTGLSLISTQMDTLIKIITPEAIYSNWQFWIAIFNFILASATLWYLIKYVKKTEELAIQAKDTNLRPVILRGGYITEWAELLPIVSDGELKKRIIEFRILKNIATSIKGYIIINNNKYELYFANDISKISEKGNEEQWRFVNIW